MITINIEDVQKQAKKRKDNPPEIVVLGVSIGDPDDDGPHESPGEEMYRQILSAPGDRPDSEGSVDPDQKAQLLKELEQEHRDIKRTRAKLSNLYPGMARHGAPPQKLAAHYQEIESYTFLLKEVYDKRRHVEQHDRLPNEVSDVISHIVENLPALREKRRSCVNVRSKTRKKLEIAKGKGLNNGKILEWEMKLEKLDIEYDYLDAEIKKLS